MKTTTNETGTISCHDISTDAIFRVFQGSCSPEYRELVRQHLRECPDCRVCWRNLYGMSNPDIGDVVEDSSLYEETKPKVKDMLSELYNMHLGFQSAAKEFLTKIVEDSTKAKIDDNGKIESDFHVRNVQDVFDEALALKARSIIANIVDLGDLSRDFITPPADEDE